MAKEKVSLGAVQETLLIPLAARARESRLKSPVLRDPRAVEILGSLDTDMSAFDHGWGGLVMVLRTATFDAWVEEFLAYNPSGTVVEMGAGLNTRFERLDNGTVRWVDVDLPDTVELRRRFFTDSERRRTVAGSVLDEGWLDVVKESPGPYFFVADGVLVYLPEKELTEMFRRLTREFPGALLAFDTYHRSARDRQHRAAAKRGLRARWQWACDDPRSLEPLGLKVLETTTVARPPGSVRGRLTASRRLTLTLLSPLIKAAQELTLFRTQQM